MLELILAAIFFVGIHLGVSGTPARQALVQRFGEKAYRAGFSVLSLVGLAWLLLAYGRAPEVTTWGDLSWFKPAMAVLMLPSFLLMVGAMTTPNPFALGGERFGVQPGPARGIFRITRHPMMWGIALWALLHLIGNGDAAALVLFGSLLLLALLGPRAIDARQDRAGRADWQRFKAATSNLPFAAIREGRNAWRPKELLDWRLAVALLAYLATLHVHARWFGVSPLF